MKLVTITYTSEKEPEQVEQALDQLLGMRVLTEGRLLAKPFFVKDDKEYDHYLHKIQRLFRIFSIKHYNISEPIELPQSYS